ncbi:MAG TPA: class I SAM-dependent methyltransferase [Verrucomicrobiae bacterium]|nr:class I SAM-dependent methyltransferase [Verrucomicrobiae bacterium]
MSAQATTIKPYKGMGMEGLVARWYAATTKKSLDRFRELAQRTARELAPGSNVLEVAPGPGYYAIELAKLGNYKITGLDISKTFVGIARANAAKAGVHIDFEHGNASNIPFPDNTFDFIVCCAAFKNFTQPQRALEEMHRVLKPGGKALIVDLRKDTPIETINQAVDAMKVGPVNRAITKLTFRFMLLKRAYTRSSFEQLIAKTPFRDFQIQENLIALEVLLKKAAIGPVLIFF